MKTRKGRAKFNNFQTPLDSGCSSNIAMKRLVEKLCPEKYYVMWWQIKAVNITINFNVKIDFILPELSSTNAVTCKFHVDDSYRGRYDMILGRDILTELVSNLYLFANASSKQMMDLLQDLLHLWLICVCKYLKI